MTEAWQYLKECHKPIVLYGMGNGADKILRVMQNYGLEAADFFASDGFVRGHSFHGKPVLSFAEIQVKYTNFVIVLSFASCLDEMLERFAFLDENYDLIVPDVPVAGDTIFDFQFAKEHQAQLEKINHLLADDESRRIFQTVVEYKITGRITNLLRQISDPRKINTELLKTQNIRSYFDLGAYCGDTVSKVLQASEQLQTVYAMEPDPRNFRKLKSCCEVVSGIDFHLFENGAWYKREIVSFYSDGSRNSGKAENGIDKGGKKRKTIDISMETVDHILDGKAVDFLKYDVEGSEKQALMGSVKTITTFHPKLCVSVYHRSEDLFSIPEQIQAMDASYRFYLRRFPYVPAWDVQLYCI